MPSERRRGRVVDSPSEEAGAQESPRGLPIVGVVGVRAAPHRSLLAVALLRPVQFPLVVALLVVGIVTLVAPDALQHSPVTFETRGLIHGTWHYSLLVGSALCMVGMFWTRPRWQLPVELAGLILLMGVLIVNMLGFISLSLSLSSSPSGDEVSGLGIALRVGVILGFALRAYVIVAEPVVTVNAKGP